jgi:hypothetical protein
LLLQLFDGCSLSTLNHKVSIMHKLFRTTLIAASMTLSSLPFIFLPSQPAQAAKWCWCTNYVASKFGLTRNYPNAADWNDGYLQRNGLTQVRLK